MRAPPSKPLRISPDQVDGWWAPLSMHATGAESFLIVPLFDMFCFTIPFALAILWRQQPEFHRRLILMATCALTAARFHSHAAIIHAAIL